MRAGAVDRRVVACIPCFNRAETLPLVIESLRNQTIVCAEIVVVDDGSGDGSTEVAKRLADRVLRNEKNLGRGAARARAVREIECDYLLFADAGSALMPNFLEKALGHFTSGNVAGAFGRLLQREEGGILTRWRGRHLFKAARDLAVESRALLATHGALLDRRAVMEVGNFNAALREGEDAELGRRLLNAGYNVVSDPALRAYALEADGLFELLERYARWNTAPDSRPSLREYLRLVSYATRSMAAEDIGRRDPGCALISLAAPHYQFWRARIRRNHG